MKILVTGSNGQLAMSLRERADGVPGIDLVAVGRPEFDLLDPASIDETLRLQQPDVIVSAAAYTAVDLAESEPAQAFAINAEGVEHLARAAARIGVPIIHISTDYVFSGRKGSPYGETDFAEPLSVYGQSKLAGERAVIASTDRHLILRTAWCHSPFGRNFVKTMLGLAAKQDRINVVADRFGNPTSTLDLADAILHAAGQLSDDHYGLYHLAGRGSINWATFARQIMDASRTFDGPAAEIVDIAASAYPTPAARPENSSLSSALFEQRFGWHMPDWVDSTRVVVERLLHQPTQSVAT